MRPRAPPGSLAWQAECRGVGGTVPTSPSARHLCATHNGGLLSFVSSSNAGLTRVWEK